MWGRTCIPRTVYQVLSPCKKHFRCAQAQHFLVFCWLLIALRRAPGKGTRKGLQLSLPSQRPSWTTVRMVRSGQGDAQAVRTDLAATTLRSLPPPTDGVLSLLGDRTRKPKRGRKHPVGPFTRHGEHAPDLFGFEIVLLIARWDRVRIPVALGLIDPQRRGHQNILLRQMLKDVVRPAWVRQVVGVAEAGWAANETLRLITGHKYPSVFALPRTRKWTHGKHLRALVQPLPKSCDYRRASHTPDGRRRDDWVLTRRATLHKLGDGTIVLSKKRRNDGPKKVQIIVTNLTAAHAGPMRSIYAWRWGVEITIKALKSGLHLGHMQGTKEAERVTRSVALSVIAYLLLVRVYGQEKTRHKEWSLFKLTERLTADVPQEHRRRSELRWQRKLKQLRDVA